MNETYLTYEEYKDFGGELPEKDFLIEEVKARKNVDKVTDCRVKPMKVIPIEVKLLMMSVISILKDASDAALAENPKVASFTTDGYSETYAKSLTEGSAERAIYRTANDLLYGVTDDYGVPLLYRGVVCERV